jgi:ATP-dependent DNA helicase RecG
MTTDQAPARTLAYLDDIPVDMVKGVGPAQKKKLERAGVTSVARLLLHAPRRYIDRSTLFDIASAPYDEEVTIGGVVETFNKRRISRGRTMVEATVSDGTSRVRCVWFNPYIKAEVGTEVLLAGKIESFRGSRQMKGPDMQALGRPDSLLTDRVVPVHPGIGGIGPAGIRRAMDNALRRSLPMTDIVPSAVLEAHRLVDRSTAFNDIHFPAETRGVGTARTRLIFDEFLRILMSLKAREHDDFESHRGVVNEPTADLTSRFLDHVPFDLTHGQEEALELIAADMLAATPMHRLLQGEVGSGKTIVVVLSLLSSVEGGHQGAVMAPTEVLATQHYLGTEQILRDAAMSPLVTDQGTGGTASLFGGSEPASRPVRIGLFTGSRVTVNFVEGDITRTQGLTWLNDGTIDIAFGTHALIQSDVRFRSLGMAVVDEQQRFGVDQRVQLRAARDDGLVPDLLLMTATPIPRTLAMTLYGDLKVSAIEGMPVGREPVDTSAVEEGPGADVAIDHAVARHVAQGRQVFVVCPLVSRSETIEAVAAEDEFLRLTDSLPDVSVGLLHGQMKSEDKATTMERFRAGEIDALVATTVIEVGVDVPNATLIAIRNAERFGLSQLHQLRGRVGRGAYPGSCLLAAGSSTDDAEARMTAMLESNDGYELAKKDLEIRGQGRLFGSTQSGAADLRLGDILRDSDLLEAAAGVAENAVAEDRDSQFVVTVLEEADRFLGSLPEALEDEVER